MISRLDSLIFLFFGVCFILGIGIIIGLVFTDGSSGTVFLVRLLLILSLWVSRWV